MMRARAYRLPGRAFVDEAVKEMTGPRRRHVMPVRLSLFAEMVRRRPWAPATLRELGGIEGIGVTFLEETFCGRLAPPAHRLHEHAAQAVLKALLPEASSDLKGNQRSALALQDAAGYANRPTEFTELMRILDNELRMVTSVDPDGIALPPREPSPSPRETYYQLTHDYLVPTLRNWLTRKQRETRQGRAELRLATFSALWRDRPERRHLPSMLEWLGILFYTRQKAWSGDDRRMMAAATRRHLSTRPCERLRSLAALLDSR